LNLIRQILCLAEKVEQMWRGLQHVLRGEASGRHVWNDVEIVNISKRHRTQRLIERR
jgi:predicted component of type VI protein secretion system